MPITNLQVLFHFVHVFNPSVNCSQDDDLLRTVWYVYSTVENKHKILLQNATAAPGMSNLCTCIFKMFQSFSPL